MGKQSLLDSVREWIGGVAFRVFLWSIRMAQDEYLDAVVAEGSLDECLHGYNGLCPYCDGMQTPPRQQ